MKRHKAALGREFGSLMNRIGLPEPLVLRISTQIR